MEKRRPTNLLAIKIIIVLTLFSSLVTLGFTALQLAEEYDNDVSQVERRIEDLKEGFKGALTTSLWQADSLMVSRQMQGILSLPDIAYVEVRTSEGNKVAFGERPERRELVHRTSLIYLNEGVRVPVGTLTIAASLQAAHDRLYDRVWIVLASNAAKALIVSVFLFFAVQWMVTRRLVRVAKHLRAFTPERQPVPLESRSKPVWRDELDIVYDAVNQMQTTLWSALHGTRSRDAALKSSVTRLERTKSHLERLLAERAREKEVAEAASRSKTAFLANMSHELRDPLNAIVGFSEIIDQELFGPLGNERYRDYVRDIHASGVHLLSIVNDLLDLSRIEAGAIHLKREPVELEEVAVRAVALAEAGPEAAGKRIELTLDEDLPCVLGDRRALLQVLLNLLSNALKFSRDGGAIRLSGAAEDGGMLLVTVTDDGIGMSEEEMALAMTPFGQVRDGYRKSLRGSGLGLPLARQLIELLGGVFDMESQPGQGTRVTLRFPPDRLTACPS